MNNLYLFQFSFAYDRQVYLPYTVGLLWAYAQSFPDIQARYQLGGLFMLRQNPAEIVAQLNEPAVAAFSTYVWNWELSQAVARQIKAKFPHCLIIFGGPQVPDHPPADFFQQYPWVDVLAHGEGELTFAEILQHHGQNPDWSTVLGISFNDHGQVKTNPMRPRLQELDVLPSPYLTGVFEPLLSLPYTFNAVCESNRGCPYACTFCDWGTIRANKIRLFDLERIQAELDYFGQKGFTHIYSADANFGMLERDLSIAQALAHAKEHHGFPHKFRVNYAKNSNERVLAVAQVLNTAELDKGITLSLQSLDSHTLTQIKRQNLAMNNWRHWIQTYREHGISTYTELIVGLPGESYLSFKQGLDQLLAADTPDALFIYRALLLPNAEMSSQEQREHYGIHTRQVPLTMSHIVPGEDPVQEYEELVVETKDLPLEDWKKCILLAWVVQTFHVFQLTPALALYWHYHQHLACTDFYEALLAYAAQNPDSLLGQEVDWVKARIEAVLNGEAWTVQIPEISPLSWEMEEASYLRLHQHLEELYRELGQFCLTLHQEAMPEGLLTDLLIYQQALVVKCEKNGSQQLNLSYPLHTWYQACLKGEPSELSVGDYQLHITDPYQFNGDRARHAQEIVFWGRRRAAMHYRLARESAHHKRDLPVETAPC